MDGLPGAAVSGRANAPRTIVCDTSVLLAGGDPRSTAEDAVYITPAVIDEVKRDEERERLDTLRATGLAVRAPTAGPLSRVEEASRTTGDHERLSVADKELVALALELQAELLTDDRSMQNVAKHLGVTYRGYAQAEIQGLWHWQSRWRCTGCGKHFEKEPPKHECAICGHAVVKKHWRVPRGESAGP